MVRYKYNKIILSLGIVGIIALLIIDPTTYIQSAYNGIILFGTSVLPALFPFFFFSKILMSIGTAEILSNVLRSPTRKLYGTPPSSSYILIMSLISGYPIGASLTKIYYENGYISERDAKTITSFASTSGSLFILGTVATQMFHNKIFGYVLLLSHYVGALLNGLLYRIRKPDSTDNNFPITTAASDNVISDAVSSSVLSILFVGGYIVVFSIIIDALSHMKIISSLSFILSFIMPEDIARTLLIGFIEVTRGCLSASALTCSQLITLPLVCFMISFGGMAIALQSHSFISGAVTMPQYLLRKFTQAIISAVICLAVTAAFLPLL